jgi:hypothetical protein
MAAWGGPLPGELRTARAPAQSGRRGGEGKPKAMPSAKSDGSRYDGPPLPEKPYPVYIVQPPDKPVPVALTAGELPGGNGAARLRLDKATRTITLDGVAYQGIDPIAFDVFAAIHKARAPISGPRVQETPGLRGKNLARELNKLPRSLRKLVKGRDGNGRWIELPPESCS